MVKQGDPEATHAAVVVVVVVVVVAEMQAFVTWLQVYGPHVLLKIPQVPLHWMEQLFPAQPRAHFAVTVPQHKALYNCK